MHIGVPAEIKDNENRVGMTPDGVETLVDRGHTVTVESGAGKGSGMDDAAYRDAGAELGDAAAAWDAELVVKIKEPLEDEYQYLEEGKVVFTYFHLAADRQLTGAVLDSGIVALAYETVEDSGNSKNSLDRANAESSSRNGELPLLEPMSQVAGRMAPLMGSYYLTKHNGGKGVLPAGIDGVDPGNVLVIGGGTVGSNAAEIAAGIGADVTVLEVDSDRIAELNAQMPANVTAVESNDANLEKHLSGTDVLVGAVLVPGGEAPVVVSEEQVAMMDDGSVVVDVAVDQGGCVATTHPTSHSDPVYTERGVTHYAVTNMPGAFPRTATLGITNATLPYVVALAEKGWQDGLRDDPALRKGLNAVGGTLTQENVAEAFGMDWTAPEDVL